MTNLTIGSLFSGYGGLDLAVEEVLGATTAWHCEWEEAPSKILAHHWPGIPNHRDVTAVDWTTVPRVDILTGGYPCQPFSQAGGRKGTNDDRHLWPHVREAISELSPSLVVLENVFGHLSLGFDEVLADLQLLNYETHWTTIRASDIGAPHHRARLFILAVKGNHDGSIRGWADRRGGIHRNPPEQVEGEPQRFGGALYSDGGQRTSSTSQDGGQVRGKYHTTQSGQREELPGSMAVGGDRAKGIEHSHGSAPRPDREAGRGECCVATPADDRRCGASPEWERDLDQADEGCGDHLCGSCQRVESEGAGPSLPQRLDNSDISCGRLVGAKRQSLWASSIPGEVAPERAHGVGQTVRASDIGATHHRARVFLVAWPQVPHPEGIRRDNGQATNDGTPDRKVHPPRDDSHPIADSERDDGGTWSSLRSGREKAIRPLSTSGFKHSSSAENENPTHPSGIGCERARTSRSGWAGSADGHNRTIEWGEYAPAIRRWERIVGPAPSPTEPNTKGKPRLAAEFASWMMGLPAGHVTGVPGLSRADQLKAIGNGVCPQQAIEALTQLLKETP